MSSQALAEFLSRVSQDTRLAEEVQEAAATATDRFAMLASIAARHGFEVRAEEVRAAAARPEHSLEDSDLAQVAGGVVTDAGAGALLAHRVPSLGELQANTMTSLFRRF